MTEKSQPSPNFSVRPPKDLLPRLRRLAADSNRSEAQIMLESVSAIIDMIEGGYDFVPAIVQRTRLWREFHARGREGMLGGGALSPADKDEILPSECVRNLSPELVFLPVFKDVPDGKIGPLTPYGELISPGKIEEYVAIPQSKCRGAHFGLKITPEAYDRISGSSGYAGRICLLATAEQLQRYDTRLGPAQNLKLDQWEYFNNPLIRIAGWFDTGKEVGQFIGLTNMHRNADGVDEIAVKFGVGERKRVIPIRKCNNLARIVHSIPLTYSEDRYR